MTGMNFTIDDRLAMVTACTHLVTRRKDSSPSATTKPLTTGEWNKLAQWLATIGRQPGFLLWLSDDDPAWEDATLPVVKERLVQLMAQSSLVSLALEELEHRGLWARTRIDEDYPPRWRERLKPTAPPVVFGAGNRNLLLQPTVAIVGSRDVGEQLQELARTLGSLCAHARLTAISGGARGTDRLAMNGAATDAGGSVVGVVSGDLDRLSRQKEIRLLIQDDRLCLVSQVHPYAGFSIGNALGRNKLIYGLADAAIIVSATEGKGGTWAGAMENLRHGWTPLLIWAGAGAPTGNHVLLREGGTGFDQMPTDGDELAALVTRATTTRTTSPTQAALALG